MCSTLKPFQPSRTRPRRELARSAQHRAAILARERAGADDDHRPLRVLQRVAELAEIAQRSRTGAQVLVVVGEIRRFADDADVRAAQPSLADARVQHRRFEARVRADQQDRVGFVDAGDGRVEE